MASKMVADRLKLRKIVVGAVTANAPKVVQSLTEHLTPLLREGETLPDIQLVQELLMRLVQEREQELVAKDDANQLELLDVNPRDRRDRLAAEVYAEVVSLRKTAEGLYGIDGVRKLLGFSGATAEDPELLLRQADQAMVRLRSDDVPTPESRSEGLETDLRQWPDRVEPKVRALEQVLQEIETERWFGFNTVSDKSGALSEFDFTVGNVTRIQRGLFALAGLFRAAELFFPQKMIQRIRNGSEESVPETSEPVEEDSPPDPPSTETPAEPDPLL
jgi:hypothetical protein